MGIEVLKEKYHQQRAVTTDTRQINDGDIYFALKGPSFDGNKFAHEALQKGASYSVVDDKSITGENIIQVENVLSALQQLAQSVRERFTFPIVGITGSNGKTTTKELIRDVLLQDFKVHATRGNLNNHIGVPITILNTPQDTEIGIVEMGANHIGEIAALCKISKPDYGLITNIGKAHLEGFGGIEGVKKGKRELYESVKEVGELVFVNANDSVLTELSKDQQRVLYGNSKSNLFLIEQNREFPTLAFDWHTNTDSFENIATHLTGGYNLGNVAAAIAIGLYFGVSPEKINKAVADYQPQNNRSQLKTTSRNNTLILDAYNANPTSMALALRNLAGIDADKKFFVIGDMLELGSSTEDEHRQISKLAESLHLDGIVVGKHFSELTDCPFPAFENSDSAIEYLSEKSLSSYTILLKGSRGIQLEKVESIL